MVLVDLVDRIKYGILKNVYVEVDFSEFKGDAVLVTLELTIMEQIVSAM